jgi:signal peptidase I
MDKAKVKKIGKIFLDVLLYAFLALCIVSVFITVLAKRDNDGAAEIFGYQMRVVTSSSMEKCELTDVSKFEIKDIPVRSMVFVKVVPDDPAEADKFYSSLKVGDVLTFRYVIQEKGRQETITHRITAITEKETGGFVIKLAGDNKNSEDGQLEQIIDTSISGNTDYVIGKVTGQFYPLGLLMSFLMQSEGVGIILLIILPCAIIILMEVLKIIKVVTAEKKQKQEDEKAQKENELEELRRRLAELENEKATDADSGEDKTE